MHHLFEPYVIRAAMGRVSEDEEPVDDLLAREVESLVERLEAERSISRQRDRIANAPVAVQQILVRLYFKMLFQVLEERSETFH